jgi:hypothetical protein
MFPGGTPANGHGGHDVHRGDADWFLPRMTNSYSVSVDCGRTAARVFLNASIRAGTEGETEWLPVVEEGGGFDCASAWLREIDAPLRMT